MNPPETPGRLSKPRIALIVAIDVVALAIGVGLYLFLKPRDSNAAILGLVSSVVFGGFFNLVIVLVSLKP